MAQKKVIKSRTSIKCSKCGTIKAVRKEVFLQRVEKFGSVGKLIANYKCQQCRNGAKHGIQCIRCEEIKAVRKDVYQQRVKRYGSEEKLLASYLCRRCRRVVKHEQKIKDRKVVTKSDEKG